jgi:hypothetical protein
MKITFLGGADEVGARAIERVRRAGGAMEPVVLGRVGDGYRLVDGVRRIRVAEDLGWTHVPAIVED